MGQMCSWSLSGGAQSGAGRSASYQHSRGRGWKPNNRNQPRPPGGARTVGDFGFGVGLWGEAVTDAEAGLLRNDRTGVEFRVITASWLEREERRAGSRADLQANGLS